MKKIVKFYKTLGFIYGAVFTVAISSIVSIAATNISGFFIFSQGGVISSSEINSNFEKLAGNVVFSSTTITSFSIDSSNSDFSNFADNPTAYSYRKKLLFTAYNLMDSDKESPGYSSSSGSNFSYFQIPSTGWYEISLIPSISVSAAATSCSAYSCSYNLSANINVLVADSLGTVKWDNRMILSNSRSLGDADTNNDQAFDRPYEWPGAVPESKKLYLGRVDV